MPGDLVPYDAPDGQTAIVRIHALDDRPGCRAGTGTHNGPFRCRFEAVIDVPVVPVLLGDTPARQGVFFEFLQASFLFILAQVHPELENQRTIIGKGLLEGQDTIKPVIEYCLAILVMHPAQYRL